MLSLHIKKKWPLWCLLSICLLGMGFYTLSYLDLMINITGSMPRGLYLRTDGAIHRGDLVAFCLNTKQQRTGIEHDYLNPDATMGMRCSLSEPLLKQVIAIPGDNVILTHRFISVNDAIHPYETIDNDTKGRPLAAYPSGFYPHTSSYWMMGTSSSRSWDSRYFGPIPRSSILAKMKPLFVFKKNKSLPSSMKHCTLIFDHNIMLRHVPLAETLSQQKKGLSGTKNAAQGMLFTFAHPRRVGFWMKDTKMPLSIGFFNANGMLVSIENMEPNTAEKLYFSAGDAKDALELPKGQFEKIGLKVGNQILQRDCH